MAKRWSYLIVIVYLAMLGQKSLSITDEVEGQALRALYRSLNSPIQLEHWKSEGGDPCGESWAGVQCFRSSVIHLKLRGLGLTGNLGFQLSDLKKLKILDLSSNKIEGSIPDSLPPNLTQLNLAENRLTQSIPYSLDAMKRLRHLNLSHNFLSGSLGDVFNGLDNLREMDLSFNNFTGDLPISFRTLTNLTSLFLQSNQFTGSVIFLAEISLSNLNIEDNHFSGVIPEKFQNIHNLWIGGNRFNKETDYPPWKFPYVSMPTGQNITSPPAKNLSAFESHPAKIIYKHKKRRESTAVVLLVTGLAVTAVGAAIALILNRHRLRQKTNSGSSEDSMKSLPISTGAHFSSMAEDNSAYSCSPMITPSRLPPVRTRMMKTSRRKSFSNTNILSISAKSYTVAELQTATNSFSEENLIGEGSLGSVYRAEFPDGVILAVKYIKTVPLSIVEEQQFYDVIKNASRLKHPNIVTLIGYCMEHGQHLLVYEFIKSLSLDEALHCIASKPLPWGLRLRIALGIAKALNYIHSSCVPPMAHSNLKAGNVLLDKELIPRVCDCGLAVLRTLASNTVKIKASEMAIADSGYVAPENVQPGIANTKADVYSFGVLLLELLTARRPVDYTRPKAEQSLVRWATSRLHDNASLAQMVDPAIAKAISSKSLSRFADMVSMCIQSEPEFRPQMSEIVESLTRILEKPSVVDGVTKVESFNRSFRSTNSRFFASPTNASFYSV